MRRQNPWRDKGKGEYMIQYVYKPYHGWRHGHRREKIRRWIIRGAKILLVVEGVILTARYLKEHTYEKVYEREVYWIEDMLSGEVTDSANSDGKSGTGNSGEFYGIGIGAEDGSLFWFHKKTEE